MISTVHVTEKSNRIINNLKDKETDASGLNSEQQFIYFQIQQISSIKKNTVEKD